MEILSIRAIEGRNTHSHYPVIEMLLDLGECAERLTSEFPQMIDALLECLPGIASHHCGVGAPGGFLTRMTEGTYFGHVVEHVALELQIAARHAVMYGKTRHVEAAAYRIVFEHQCAEAGLYAARTAVEMVESLVAGRRPDVAGHISMIQSLARQYEMGPSTKAIAKAAEDRGIPVTRLGNTSMLQLGYGSKQRSVEATITSRTSCIGVDLACDKVLTKMLLHDAGIPVPEGGVARTEKEALEVAGQLGYPLVVKPRDGNQGKGVTINLKTEDDVLSAFRAARGFCEDVVIERYLQGRHYRVLVIGGKVAAVSERLPAFVMGDGRHTVAELVKITNSDPMRGDDHELPLTRIKADDVAKHVLSRQNLSLASVPGRGNIVYLRENANLSTGGVAIDATDDIHPDNARMAVRAADIVGLDVAGVDIIVDHISLPIGPTGGGVIEVNAAPGIRMHLYPWKGRPRDVGRQIVDHLFPGGNGRIPIVAVTGTNGKTTVVRMVASVLSGAGYVVGTTCTDGVFINGEMTLRADASGARSARAILRSPDVDAAVLETARGGLIRNGLAFDRCDVAVVTNIADDHVGQDGVDSIEDLAQVKALLIEVVLPEGYAVLNADDAVCLSIADRASGRIMLFSSQPDNLTVRKHVSSGGRAIVQRGGFIVSVGPERPVKIMPVKGIPATFGGTALFNVQNALAAVAACVALGVDPERIAEALGQFRADSKTNPGRLNVIESGGFTVVLDYGHNVPALIASVASLRAMFAHKGRRIGHLIGVIASPGDRTDERIMALGRAAAGEFSSLVIKEDHDLRGRVAGATAELLRRGALEVGPDSNVRVVLDEVEAIKTALRMATKHDVVIVYYETYDEAWSSIMKWTAELAPQAQDATPDATAVAGTEAGKA